MDLRCRFGKDAALLNNPRDGKLRDSIASV